MNSAERLIVEVDYHSFCLAPWELGGPAEWGVPEVMEVCENNKMIGRTWCAMGLVSVTVAELETNPGPLAEAIAAGDWQAGEEDEMDVQLPLSLFGFAMEIQDEYLHHNVFVPRRPGKHRVRVLTKGRVEEEYDGVADEPVEQFRIELWPVH